MALTRDAHIVWITEEEYDRRVHGAIIAHVKGQVDGYIVQRGQTTFEWTETLAEEDVVLHSHVIACVPGYVVLMPHDDATKKVPHATTRLIVKGRGQARDASSAFAILAEYIANSYLKDSYVVDMNNMHATFVDTTASSPVPVSLANWKLLVVHIMDHFEIDVLHELEHRAHIVCPALQSIDSSLFV